MPEKHGVSDLQLHPGRHSQRRLHLACALQVDQPQARRPPGQRQLARARRPGRHVAPARARDHARLRLPRHLEREKERRSQRQPVVVIEQMTGDKSRPGRHLGQRRLVDRAAHAARAAAVEQPQREPALPQRRRRLRAEIGHAPPRQRLDGALRGAHRHRRLRVVIRQPRHLRLVAHQPRQPQPRAAARLLGQPHHVLDRAQRAAQHAQVHRSACQPQRHVDLDHDLDLGDRLARRAIEQVEVLHRVDHHGDLLPARRQPRQRLRVDPLRRRIRQQQVIEPALRQEHRLGRVVGHPALHGRAPAPRDVAQQLHAPQRLGGHPQRLARAPHGPQQRLDVAIHRVQVHHRRRQPLPRQRLAQPR